MQKYIILGAAVSIILSCSSDNDVSEITPEPTLIQWYVDADEDGFGNPDITLGRLLATQPDGFVKDNTDCDDTDAKVYPSAKEDAYDGIDSNCDGLDEMVINTFSQTYDLQMESDIANDLVKTSDGGYLISSNSFLASPENSINGPSIWLLKFDATGKLEWDQLYGGLDSDYVAKVIQTSDGGYLVSGASKSAQGTVSSNAGNTDWLLFKIDSAGNLQWTKSFGGTRQEGITDILETQSGNYFVVGESWSSDGDFSRTGANSSAWFIMLTPTGDLIWKTHWDGGAPNDVIQLEDGSFFALGDIFVNGNNTELTLWNVNQEGEITFAKTFIPGEYFQIHTRDMFQDSNGNILVCGSVWLDPQNSDGMLLNMTLDGDTNWIKLIGNEAKDILFSITPGLEGTFFTTGHIIPSKNAPIDVWLSKYNLNGDQLWERQIGGSDFERACNVIILEDESLMMLASTKSKDGPITDKSEENESFDLWFFKLKPNGQF